jgi:glycerol-3-phosphate O-acyltransferase/dihydroxyacetone phosphate acyltransferase
VQSNAELLAPVDYVHIRSITAQMHQQISCGTIDSPSWDLVRIAKLAARIYAPLGTRMSLGDHVRVVRTFLEALKSSANLVDQLDASPVGENGTPSNEAKVRVNLSRDLKVLTHFLVLLVAISKVYMQVYQDQISRLGIKDDRIRRPLRRRTILSRIVVRLLWSLCLFTISFPGLALWLPVFGTTFYAVHNFKKSGPIWDTWDELAQYKLIYGLMSGLCVWFACMIVTFPIAGITAILVPTLMWMTLRWLEDAVSALRALFALVRLLQVGQPTLKSMYECRAELHSRVMILAVESLGLPDDPEGYFVEAGGRQKGRVRGRWESRAGYFSVRRRRKRDWNETLRLYDKVDYPADGL